MAETERLPLLVLHSRWPFVAAGKFCRRTNLRPLCTRMSCIWRAFHLANLHCSRSVDASDYPSLAMLPLHPLFVLLWALDYTAKTKKCNVVSEANNLYRYCLHSQKVHNIYSAEIIC